jgi:signal transduction histidine kinase
VTDQGIGISEKELPYIFERFYRAHKGEKKEIKGSGLGLTIAKEIVTGHGGRIRAESIPGKGSTFTFELPVYNEDWSQ